MEEKLVPVRFSRIYKQWNPGEVAGFDDKTARWLVDNDFAVAVEVKETVDPKTGKKTHTVIGEKALAPARRAPAPPPENTGNAGEGDKTGDKPGDKK